MISAVMDKRELQKLTSRLGSLDGKIRRRVVGNAVSAGVRVMRKRVKSEAPKMTGTLRRSIGFRRKTYTNRGVSVGVVGPDRRHAETHEVTNRLTGKKGTKRVVPANIAHLLEHGHRIVIGGTLSARQAKAGFDKYGRRRRGHTRSAAKASRTSKGSVVGFVKPVPYLLKAADASRQEATAKFVANLRTGILREAAKLT